MLNDAQIEAFVEQGKNKNTKRKTAADLFILNAWRENVSNTNAIEPLEDLNPFNLNKILRSFFITIKKKDGNDYEPGSLRGIFSSIERHLLSKKYV